MTTIQESTALWYFVRGYIGAALWSSHGDDDEPLDAKHDIDDIAPESLAKLEAIAGTFYAAHQEHIHCEGAPLSSDMEGPISHREAARAGHDLWLNQNGHGAGFWDGDWPEPAASILDKAARELSELDLYIGDDGKIYC